VTAQPAEPTQPSRPAPLARRLGLADGVVIGVGSMLGAGVFAVFAPAAAAAGWWLLGGLGLAALVAYANATSTAQLAARYPTSGGAYAYGRERLGPWWGFAAGWSFVVGKTASCAAMALTFAAYAAPGAQRPVAALDVVALVAVNARGVTRTAQVTRVLVAATALVLVLVVVVAWQVPAAEAQPGGGAPHGVHGVLQSAGLLFFAFAGYARVATLGEEVRNPRVTIPRAIQLALGIVVVVYAVVGFGALRALGADGLAGSTAPLADVVGAAGWPGGDVAVRVGAAAACGGALLGLVAGVGRTTLAMAREGDLPRPLAAVHPVHRVPARAEAVLGAVLVVLVLVADVRTAVGFSSFAVLTYYAVANLAALTQGPDDRRWPRGLQVLGLVGCLTLAASLPLASVRAGSAVLVVGLVGRAVARAAVHREPGA
jgi:APA family basic amino acid/polyamine antiporter